MAAAMETSDTTKFTPEFLMRFWAKVNKTSGCWLWTAAKVSDGYGVMGLMGKTQRANRISWLIANGRLDKGAQVCHVCDNPACVNPGHLFLGAHLENAKDRNAKGRQAKGSRHGRVKLTHEKAEQLRDLYSRGLLTQSQVGEVFGVSQYLVSRVVNGKAWTQTECETLEYIKG